jgi:hypothetical protein
MKKGHKKLLSDLNKIATHFKLKLSKAEAVKNTAFAIDNSRKKFIFINEADLPYFKTIDLRNVDICTVKFDYSRIDAGDLNVKNMDEFIDKVQLQISHFDPSKSLNIDFYDSKKDKINELRPLIDKATSWRDSIAAKLPARVLVRA